MKIQFAKNALYAAHTDALTVWKRQHQQRRRRKKNPLESNECWHCVVVLWCIAKHSIPMLRFFFARSITRFIFLLQCDWLHIDWIRIVVTLCKVNNQLCCGRLFSSLFSLSIPIGFLSIVCIAEYLIHRTNLMGKTKVCASTKQATKKNHNPQQNIQQIHRHIAIESLLLVRIRLSKCWRRRRVFTRHNLEWIKTEFEVIEMLKKSTNLICALWFLAREDQKVNIVKENDVNWMFE